MPQLMKNYIDTGKVSFEVRDFPLTQIHSGALMAAQAANCSAEQGQFFLMRKTIFDGAANQEWRDGSLDDLTTFGNYASAVGTAPYSRAVSPPTVIWRKSKPIWR